MPPPEPQARSHRVETPEPLWIDEPSSTLSHAEPSVANRELLRRLGREFDTRLPADVVVDAVLRAEAEMSSARIKTFVPILVERHARQQLREQARQQR